MGYPPFSIVPSLWSVFTSFDRASVKAILFDDDTIFVSLSHESLAGVTSQCNTPTSYNLIHDSSSDEILYVLKYHLDWQHPDSSYSLPLLDDFTCSRGEDECGSSRL